MNAPDLTVELKRQAAALGFSGCAVALVEPLVETRAVIEGRIGRGSYAELPWFTVERAAIATDASRSLDQARAVIALAAPYRAAISVSPDPLDDQPRGRIARYAWGRDYHRALARPLKTLIAWLTENAPGCRSRAMVDSGPLAERAFAARAGLGWFGKSTNLLTPGAGSWVLLAEILTTAALTPDAPLRKTCGVCTRCVAACPTDAIIGPYDMDNQLCISFQTIEQRGPIPRHLRPLLGNWIFGCDVCQDACPVPSRAEAMVDFRPASLDVAAPPLIPLLALSETEFRGRFAGRPVMRAKRSGLLRNVCVALGNSDDDRAIPALTRALSDISPLVRGHAAWALGRLHAHPSLHGALRTEPDHSVRDEIKQALDGVDGAAPPVQQPLKEWLAGRRWQP